MALPGFTALVRGEAAGRRAAAAPIAAMLGHRLHTTRGSGEGRVEHNVRQALAHPWEVPEWVSGHVGGRSAASLEREEAMLDFEMRDFRQDYIGAPATPPPGSAARPARKNQELAPVCSRVPQCHLFGAPLSSRRPQRLPVAQCATRSPADLWGRNSPWGGQGSRAARPAAVTLARALCSTGAPAQLRGTPRPDPPGGVGEHAVGARRGGRARPGHAAARCHRRRGDEHGAGGGGH